MNLPNEIITKVQGQSESPTKMSLRSGKFSLVIDEPEAMGGSGDGPTPMQVLLFALAGCLNMTSHFIAKEWDIKVKNINVEIIGTMNPLRFMGMESTDRSGFKKVIVKLTPELEGEYPEELIQKWIKETEVRCPVTDNIKENTTIQIEVK